MVFVPATVLGGLPVIAEVWFSGPDNNGEYDAGVDGLYWRKRDGTRGKELSQRVVARIEKQDSYWQAYITEQANDWLSDSVPIRYSDGRIEGDYSEEYLKLNRRKGAST